jgi:hypothetical protein
MRAQFNNLPVQVHHVRRQNDKDLDDLQKYAALLFENHVDWPGDSTYHVYSSNGDYEDWPVDLRSSCFHSHGLLIGSDFFGCTPGTLHWSFTNTTLGCGVACRYAQSCIMT